MGECLSLKLSFSFPLVFQWRGASHENQFLGTTAQISSLKLPLKTPAEGFFFLVSFFLLMKLLEPVLNSTILFAKLFKIPGFSLAEFCINLLFLMGPTETPQQC